MLVSHIPYFLLIVIFVSNIFLARIVFYFGDTNFILLCALDGTLLNGFDFKK